MNRKEKKIIAKKVLKLQKEYDLIQKSGDTVHKEQMTEVVLKEMNDLIKDCSVQDLISIDYYIQKNF